MVKEPSFLVFTVTVVDFAVVPTAFASKPATRHLISSGEALCTSHFVLSLNSTFTANASVSKPVPVIVRMSPPS